MEPYFGFGKQLLLAFSDPFTDNHFEEEKTHHILQQNCFLTFILHIEQNESFKNDLFSSFVIKIQFKKKRREKAALRQAFHACVYCMQLCLQSMKFKMLCFQSI